MGLPALAFSACDPCQMTSPRRQSERRRQEVEPRGWRSGGATLALSMVGIGERSSRPFEAIGDIHKTNDDAAAGFKLTRLIFALGDLVDQAPIAPVGYCH